VGKNEIPLKKVYKAIIGHAIKDIARRKYYFGRRQMMRVYFLKFLVLVRLQNFFFLSYKFDFLSLDF